MLYLPSDLAKNIISSYDSGVSSQLDLAKKRAEQQYEQGRADLLTGTNQGIIDLSNQDNSNKLAQAEFLRQIQDAINANPERKDEIIQTALQQSKNDLLTGQNNLFTARTTQLVNPDTRQIALDNANAAGITAGIVSNTAPQVAQASVDARLASLGYLADKKNSQAAKLNQGGMTPFPKISSNSNITGLITNNTTASSSIPAGTTTSNSNVPPPMSVFANTGVPTSFAQNFSTPAKPFSFMNNGINPFTRNSNVAPPVFNGSSSETMAQRRANPLGLKTQSTTVAPTTAAVTNSQLNNEEIKALLDSYSQYAQRASQPTTKYFE